MKRVTLLLCLATAALLAGHDPAGADVFEPIALLSASPSEQADHGKDPAISADRRYVAFDGSFGGVTGVWRRDLATGQIEEVAGGDAQLPSISANGQYVSFTTNEGGKLPEITNGLPDPPYATKEAPNVYVRDMSVAPFQEPAWKGEAFKIASAPDGLEVPLSYQTNEAELEHSGSLASGRSAISADGRKVVFATSVASNLVEPNTPPFQVAVRELDTKRTTLVSVEYDPTTGKPATACEGCPDKPVAAANVEGGQLYGAIYPGGRQRPSFPAAYAGASISADGSTVAWLGQEIEKQAPELPAEPNMGPTYAEPLWRRIADGPQAPTRRVTGGGDPANPACAASGESAPSQPPTLSDPCQGPFETTPVSNTAGVWAPTTVDYLPRLSADGLTVAFLTNAREVASGEEFGSGTASFSDDLYVVDMRPGLTRIQALRRLTEVAGGNVAEPSRVAPIVDLGVSPDGSEVAFSTERTVFPLGSPSYVSAPVGLARAQELFDVDLANDTLTRVTHGYEGGVSEPSLALAGSPSFSEDGNALAFASTASNLIYGDGNGASDAFSTQRARFGASAPPQFISPAPANPTTQPAWLLGVGARSLADGRVVLDVSIPQAGNLSAGADSAVLVGGAGRTAHGKRADRGGKWAARRGTVVARSVARAATFAQPSGEGLVSLALVLAARYRPLAAQRGGLAATVSVALAVPGRPTLRAEVPVTFRRTIKPHKSRRHGRGAARHRTRGGAGR